MKSYEEILELAQNCGSNHTEAFGGRFKGGYEIQQRPEEVAGYLFDLQEFELPFGHYLEIGVCGAGLTRLLCDVIKVKDVYLLDLGITPYPHCPNLPEVYNNNVRNFKNTGVTVQLWGSSLDQKTQDWFVDSDLLDSFSLIFVDGSHETEDVISDAHLAYLLSYFDNYSGIGGLVAFHDSRIQDGSVFPAIERLKNGLIPGLLHIKDYEAPHGVKGISVFRKVK